MKQLPLSTCCLAEVLGTFVLIFFGLGAVHVAVLTGDLSGLWQVGVVWGVSIMLAVYAFGAISGAHINPAITIALASWNMFSWRRAAPYIAAQMLGAALAAVCLLVIFGPYLEAKEAEKGVVRGEPGSEITAMCYGEYYPNPGVLAAGAEPYNATLHTEFNGRVSTLAACLAELLGTAMLGFMVAAMTEERNPAGPKDMAPVFIGLTVAGLICVIAPITQACFNPARDFGPRLVAYFAGWGDIALPGPRGWSILAVYAASPIMGAVLGVGLQRRVVRPAILMLDQAQVEPDAAAAPIQESQMTKDRVTT